MHSTHEVVQCRTNVQRQRLGQVRETHVDRMAEPGSVAVAAKTNTVNFLMKERFSLRSNEHKFFEKK